MIPYTFSVLRYMHDAVTAEFVNIGVALYSSDAAYLRAKCTTQYGRITRVFDRIDGDRFKQLVRYIEDGVTTLGLRLRQHTLPFADFEKSIEALVKTVLPADDSAIQFGPPGFGVSADLSNTLQQLYERYVERYAGTQETLSRSDDEVWKIFREKLERRNILPYLLPKKIAAPDFEYEFKAAWKNEAWHVYEPISFDLVEPAAVLDKANRWLGRTTNLAESTEPFKLHFLVGAPRTSDLDRVFEKAMKIISKSPAQPELVPESEAERFSENLERELSVNGANQPTLFLDVTDDK